MVFKIICIICLAFLIIEDLFLLEDEKNNLTMNIGFIVMVICNFLPLLYILMN